MKRIFIDADVIIDVAQEREDFYVDSANVINLIEANEFEGFTSVVIIANVYYIQCGNSNHFKTIEFIQYIRPILTILSVTDTMIDKALISDFKDFEDAIQYYCALENDIDCIVTRNKKDFRISQIPVYTPTEFLNKFKTS